MFSESLLSNSSLKVVNIRYNNFRSWHTGFKNVVHSANLKRVSLVGMQPGQTKFDMIPKRRFYIEPEMQLCDAVLLAGDISTFPHLESVCLLQNQSLDKEMVSVIRRAKADHPNLKTLCGFSRDATEIHIKRPLSYYESVLVDEDIRDLKSLVRIKFRCVSVWRESSVDDWKDERPYRHLCKWDRSEIWCLSQLQ